MSTHIDLLYEDARERADLEDEQRPANREARALFVHGRDPSDESSPALDTRRSGAAETPSPNPSPDDAVSSPPNRSTPAAASPPGSQPGEGDDRKEAA